MSQVNDTQEAQAIYDEIAHILTITDQAVAGKMFGMQVIKINGKVFAGFTQNAMAFKLARADHATAMTLSGAKPFDPSGMQRPMKEWVQVPFEHAAQWSQLASAALRYVKSIRKK